MILNLEQLGHLETNDQIRISSNREKQGKGPDGNNTGSNNFPEWNGTEYSPVFSWIF